MAITTFDQLKTAVSDYLARSDLTSYIPDYIIGAESRINYGAGMPLASEALRIRAMETDTDLTFSSATGRTVALPTDFLQMRRVYVSANPNRILQQTTPELFYGNWIGSSSGNASKYIIEGDNITVGPEEAGTYKMLYYKKFGDLATNSTNWLLTNHPHVYVYGALLEAAPFLHNDERIQTWHGMFTSAISGLMNADRLDRWSGSSLQIRSDAGHY